MKHTIKHALPPERARAAGIAIFQRYAADAQLRWLDHWRGEVTFSLLGARHVATFQITTSTIEVAIPSLPGWQAPAAKMAIDAEAKKAIAAEQRRAG